MNLEPCDLFESHNWSSQYYFYVMLKPILLMTPRDEPMGQMTCQVATDLYCNYEVSRVKTNITQVRFDRA